MAQAIMTKKEIEKAKSLGYEADCYGGDDGYISEISFTLRPKDGGSIGLQGFSFMSCELRQRTLRRLFERVKAVYPNLIIEKFCYKEE